MIWGSLPCVYYRHPSSAAWIPAPSGGRLRRSVGLASGPTGRAGSLYWRQSDGQFGPPRSWFFLGEFVANNSPRNERGVPPKRETVVNGTSETWNSRQLDLRSVKQSSILRSSTSKTWNSRQFCGLGRPKRETVVNFAAPRCDFCEINLNQLKAIKNQLKSVKINLNQLKSI